MNVLEIFDLSRGEQSGSIVPNELFPNNYLVGLEHEMEGARDSVFSSSLSKWNIMQDGSLRNGGVEFVLKQPEGGASLEAAIDELSTFLGDNSRLHGNDRTSTHLHVDVRSLSAQQLLLFFVVYTTFENLLFNMCDQSRKENNFCVPIRKNQHQLRSLREFAKDVNNLRVARNLAHGEYRYCAMNLASLARFGSLEFRMRELLVDKEALSIWINAFLNIRSFVESFASLTPAQFFNTINTRGGAHVAGMVFGDVYPHIAQHTQNVEAEIDEGACISASIYLDTSGLAMHIPTMAAINDGSTGPLMSFVERNMGGRVNQVKDYINIHGIPNFPLQELDLEDLTFRLRSVTADWWRENIRRARRIESRDVTFKQAMEMQKTLERDSVRDRIGYYDITSFIIPSQLPLWHRAVAQHTGVDATEQAQLTSSNLFDSLIRPF
jgi:hypothetical protein